MAVDQASAMVIGVPLSEKLKNKPATAMNG